ncbi:carbohydrate esterase family 8 protein [Leucosporidium creatinivorum]|uniref:Pectinesterase n=1 Tax=Leucosporidium creatinivorum TaxID=106004 RepID=A0A1Y2FD12_9BASI|nr:carbohydrate esterase family 8 protein [Leucosporidium creatinivorum]
MLLPFAASALLALLATAEARPSSTTPSRGALVVRQHNTQHGEYSSVSAAVAALGNSSNEPATIFAHRGVYNEQVYITYPGPLTLIGETKHPRTYKSNLVTVTFNLSKNEAGQDDNSGTLRVHKDDFTMYNINVANTYGHPVSQSQALALSAYGKRQGYYGSSFTGYQDTVLTDTGSQYFGSCAVTGAVDFVFGETAATYFRGSDIFSVGAGCITAGKPKDGGMGIYVFDECTVQQGVAATNDLTGQVYLGRPWGDYAQSVYLNSNLSSIINPAGWSSWSSSTPNTDHVVYGEYQNTGSGASTSKRASFSTVLTTKQSQEYGIAEVLGSDWSDWVDEAYY